MGFLKEAFKVTSRTLYDPLATLRPSFYKDSVKLTEHTAEYFKPPRPLKPTAAQKFLEAAQLEQLSKLNAQENSQRKRLFAGAPGVRAYDGSPLFRSLPGNSAGGDVLGMGTGGLLR